MSDEVEITDGDREAAASVAVLAEMRELILSGRADHHAEPWALHRQRGKLEGARLAIEAAAKDAEEWFPFDTSKRYPSFGVVASIRALDPAKIVGEG